MSGRRLSHRQQRRIRQARATRAARRDGETGIPDGPLGPEQSGLVIAHQGGLLLVEDAAGQVWRCHRRATAGDVVCGDDCVFCAGEPYGVIVAALPRRSELLRPDPYGKARAVAANIDRVFVVVAPEPAPHHNLVDRYLVAIELMGAEGFLLVNKSDLRSGDDTLGELGELYAGLGYPVLFASAAEGDIGALQAALGGHRSVLVGQSGVGKTSLVQALLPAGESLRIGDLSDGKGTHTTTTAQLYRLPGGGALIDSPGIREFGLWHVSATEVLWGFRELRAQLGHCRFRNCTHQDQPGCALEAALAAGEISQLRFDSYRRIVASLPAA